MNTHTALSNPSYASWVCLSGSSSDNDSRPSSPNQANDVESERTRDSLVLESVHFNSSRRPNNGAVDYNDNYYRNDSEYNYSATKQYYTPTTITGDLQQKPLPLLQMPLDIIAESQLTNSMHNIHDNFFHGNAHDANPVGIDFGFGGHLMHGINIATEESEERVREVLQRLNDTVMHILDSEDF